MIYLERNGKVFELDAVKAPVWQTWNMSLLGPPKMHYLCGGCRAENRKRPLIEASVRIACSRCEYCGALNLFCGPDGRYLTFG